METCKDIPPAVELKKRTPFEAIGPNGIVQFMPFRLTRGEGNKKWCFSIDGFCSSEPRAGEQYYVFYKGSEIGATMKPIKQMENGWQATLETIISNPEFWGEA